MALGDATTARGWDVLPSVNPRNQGADEITKTRDYAAAALTADEAEETTFRNGVTQLGSMAGRKVTSGTGAPSGGADGDIYLQRVT